MKVNTIEEWDEIYKPEKNWLDDSASWGGVLYETYGEEVKYVFSQPKHHVWTYVDGDSGTYLATGVKVCNRIGYLVTDIPWTEEMEIKVSEDA